MSDKHHIVVPVSAAWPYLANGYQRSAESAEARLGSGWQLLPHEDRKDLIVLEIDEARHDLLNRNPRRFGVARINRYVLYDLEPRSYELLEGADEFPGVSVLVSRTDRDDGAVSVPKVHLHLTAEEAWRAALPAAQAALAEYKQAVLNIEAFLTPSLGAQP
jgi:hypothetical protein